MKKTVFLTIGQAPRLDLEDIFHHFFDRDSVDQAGLLDGLTLEEAINTYGILPDTKEVLISRLVDGTTIKMDHTLVQDALKKKVTKLEADGYEIIVILCTSVFHGLSTQTALLVEPETIISREVIRKTGTGRLGIVVPLKEQITVPEDKWNQAVNRLSLFCSPYSGNEEDFLQIGEQFSAQKADLVILDCMGYHTKMKNWIQNTFHGEVWLSNEVLFEYVKQKAKEPV